MTIRKLGKLYPAQVFLLKLAGYVLRRDGLMDNPSPDEVAASRRGGLEGLRKITGEDFGDDILAWHAFLMKHGKYGLQSIPGFKIVVELLQARGFPITSSEGKR
jgi:hypothetical protein